MNKTFIFIVCLLVTLSSALALTIEEKVSATTVTPGGKILMTYTPKEYTGKVIWLVGRTVPAGFTIKPTNGLIINEGRYGYLGFDVLPMTVELTAPGTVGTYTLTAGEWGIVEQLANNQTAQAESTYSNIIITVSGTPVTNTTCTPNWQTGAWSNATDACGTRTVTDTNNCGISTGRPVTSLSCTTAKKSICENLPPIAGDCTIDTIIWVFIGLMVMAMFSRMVRR